MRLEVIVMVNTQERLNLPGQEQEKVLGSTGGHQFPGDHDLGLRKGECIISMEVNGADAKVRSAKVDC